MEAQLKVPQGELNPTLWDPKALTLRSGADARLLGVDRPGQHQNQVVFGAALSGAFSQAALADGIASSNRTANAGRGRGPWGTAPWPDGTGARRGAVAHLKARPASRKHGKELGAGLWGFPVHLCKPNYRKSLQWGPVGRGQGANPDGSSQPTFPPQSIPRQGQKDVLSTYCMPGLY